MHDVIRDVAISIAYEGRNVFLVSHDRKSKEFPKITSDKQYSHISVVADRFDELPEPISCPRLEFLMLELNFEEFKLQDDFFVGMSGLKVLNVSGFFNESILTFPASFHSLSDLRMLSLSNLMQDDISIIGELISLEILSIKDFSLEVLPLEIGKLTNLIMLEVISGKWNCRLEIAPGVLSRLVRLEELHIEGVKDCSYSILREVESLSKLTALTLSKCASDVIHCNLDLSSKLTRYSLQVGQPPYVNRISETTYDRKIDLTVTETTPLGDWICHMLGMSEVVRTRGNGSKTVLDVIDGFQNVRDLCLSHCDSLTHLVKIHYRNIEDMKVACPNDEEEEIPWRKHIRPEEKLDQVIKFPNLYKIELQSLRCLTHFYNDTVEGIEFPQLKEMCFNNLPLFENFWPKANNGMLEGNSITDPNPLFDEKVSCPCLEKLKLVSCPHLEKLKLGSANSITALCSHHLPPGYFGKLVELEVSGCGKLRDLMSPSVARDVLNLRQLRIIGCQSMEEVITEEEQGEETINESSIFPQLEKLELVRLPKLGRFIMIKHPLEYPNLRKVVIRECPEMKTFVQLGSVSTQSLARQLIEDAEVKDDLNKVMHEDFFNSKVSYPRLEELVLTGADNLTSLCSHQLPMSKLERLEVSSCGKLRNLMSPSMARGAMNLRELKIEDCPSMEEVITEEEQGEGRTSESLILPRLDYLALVKLPKLRHFILAKSTLVFSILGIVRIDSCPEMKTFVQQGSMSTPRLLTEDAQVKDDLNKVKCNQLFNSQVSCPSLGELTLDKANNITDLCSHQLPSSFFSKLEKLEVNCCGKLRNLMSPSLARGALNLRQLKIEDCPSMEEAITEEERGEGRTSKSSIFPKLEHLALEELPKLRHFILAESTLEFPILRDMTIDSCPEINTFVQQGSMSTPRLLTEDAEMKDGLNKVMRNQLFNSQVSCPSLGKLTLDEANNITDLCSHQLPSSFFSELEKLEVSCCDKLRNLMCPSMARGALNLRQLKILDCPSMEEVITEEEQGEAFANESLFPQLHSLFLAALPKLGHFFLTEGALNFQFLSRVEIYNCPEMKTFVLGSVSTTHLKQLSVKSVSLDRILCGYNRVEEYVKEKGDLNEVIQQFFNSEKQKASDGNQSEARDGDESKVCDGASNGIKSEVCDSASDEPCGRSEAIIRSNELRRKKKDIEQRGRRFMRLPLM